MALEPALSHLTDKQAVFCASYIREPNARKAAQEAGYSHPEAGYMALQSPAVQRAIADARARMIQTEGATLAYQTLIDCMKPANPGSVRVAAAKVVATMAGMLDKTTDKQEKSLTEMSGEELADAIRKMDEQMAKLADSAAPARQVIDGDAQ